MKTTLSFLWKGLFVSTAAVACAGFVHFATASTAGKKQPTAQPIVRVSTVKPAHFGPATTTAAPVRGFNHGSSKGTPAPAPQGATPQVEALPLLNIDFGGNSATAKTGAAAIGQTNDFWNFYSRDDGKGGWLTLGAVGNLKYADGSASSVGAVVVNMPGAWSDGSTDPMYDVYIYPFGGTSTLNVTNLPTGSYDFYLYAPDGKYHLTVDGTDYGTKALTNAPIVNPVVWQEGVQYVVMRNVAVVNGQTASITISAGVTGYALLAGLQIAPASGAPDTTAPSITTQPASQTANLSSNVTFTVLASGATPLAYQWYFNTGPLSGQTAYKLALTNVQTSDAGSYQVVVSNAYGSVTSAVATLSVSQLAPVIVAQPRSQALPVGASAFFTVGATGVQPLIYQWSFNGSNLFGATRSYLPLGNVQPANAGAYAVRVSNPFGAVTSAIATLVVTGAPPSIVMQPASQTVPSGTTVTFGVGARGSLPLYYQWRWNDVALAGATRSYLTLANVQTNQAGAYSVVVSNWVGQAVSTNAQLAVVQVNHPPVAKSQGAVVAYNGSVAISLTGSDPDNDLLTYTLVSQPTSGTLSGTAPSLTYQPATNFSGVDSFTFKVNDGQVDSAPATVSITVLPDGSKPLINVDFGANYATGKTGPAATGHTTNDFWNFYTRDDGRGGWRSFGALSDLQTADGALTGAGLTVANAPGAWSNGSLDPMYNVYIYPFDGGNVTITFTNLPAGQYDVLPYAYDGNYEVTVDGLSYGVKQCLDRDCRNTAPVWTEGVQYVRFTNVLVSAGQTLVLTVQPGVDGYAVISGLQLAQVEAPVPMPVSILEQPASQTVAEGSDVSFGVSVAGSAPFRYQWRFNGDDLSGATSASLVLHQVTAANAGSYSVRVVNPAGAVTSDDAVLAVTPINHPPVAKGQSLVVPFNGSVAITLAGSDPDNNPLSYTVVSQPAHGSLSGTAPSLTYQAAAGFSGADSFTFKVNDGQLDSALATISLTVLGDASKQLINVDFGSGVTSPEVGPAAIGQTASDFWNLYSRDDGYGNWRSFGVLSNLKTAEGVVTPVGLTVANAPGAWGNGSADPMYYSYIYPFNGGNVTVTVTNLAAGQYDFYVYGIDSAYQLAAGGSDYGTQPLPNGPVVNPVVWQEGLQFVLFRNVVVGADGAPVVLTVTPGQGGYATLAGLQIAGTSSTNHAPVALSQNLTLSQGGTKAIVLTGSDLDHNPLTFAVTTLPVHGTLSGTVPNLTYAPFADFTGSDSFTFTVNDGQEDSAPATVNIQVLGQMTSRLIDVDFGGGTITLKTGPAALGQSAADLWNFYTRDDGKGGWLNFGVLSNLKYVDGTPSGAGMTVANAAGEWHDDSLDFMYNYYIYPYPNGSGTVTITLTNLPAGQYSVLPYAYDGNYEVTVGGLSYGIKRCLDRGSHGTTPVWTEGVQYVRFTNVVVSAGQALVLTVRPGADGYSVISGLQLQVGTASTPPPATNMAPVVSARLAESLVLPGDTNLWVVAANGSNATVRLDGSLSADANHDALTYSWLENFLTPIATGVQATNTFDLGSHDLTLAVSDGQAVSTAPLQFQVITMESAVLQLVAAIEQPSLDRTLKRELEDVLVNSSGSSELDILTAFQLKVQYSVTAADPTLATELENAAQYLINQLNAGAPL